MNLMDLVKQAGGDGVARLAERFGVTQEQIDQVLQAVVPALSAGMRRLTGSGEGLATLAGLLRADSAAPAAAAPVQNAETADAEGGALLDTLFGARRSDVVASMAKEGAAKSGLSASSIAEMVPAIAGVALGALQQRESADSSLGEAVSGLLGGGGGLLGSLGGVAAGMLGGGDAAGPDLGALMGLLSSDDDAAGEALLDRAL